MAFLFGGARKSGHENLRDYQRSITSSARGMEREMARMDQQEKVLQRELARCAADSNLEVATAKAKEMVRLRAHRSRVRGMKGHMLALAQQLQSVQSTQKMQETLALTGRMLQGLNARTDAVAVARMLAEFEKQNTLMANKQEVMEDTLDGMFEAEGELEATNDAVMCVLQEAGLDVQSRLKGVGATAGMPDGQLADMDLDARLERLRPPPHP
jgi:charged multivesicular body protein 2A